MKKLVLLLTFLTPLVSQAGVVKFSYKHVAKPAAKASAKAGKKSAKVAGKGLKALGKAAF